MKTYYFLFTVLTLLGCGEQATQEQQPDPYESLSNSLIFHASFDGSTDADYAVGSAQLQSAASFNDRFNASVGLQANPHVSLLPGQGKFGDALEFRQKSKEVVFYSADQNLAYDSTDWDATVSFWLQLDPATDLEPGFCDPIQISDVGYNDAGLWVDFTDKNPRTFRLGVICELEVWDPEGKGPTDNPAFLNRLISADTLPFSRDTWTHVAFTIENLNDTGSIHFYLNGELQGQHEQVTDPFIWEEDKAKIVLGLNYVGLIDELSVFDRALSADEIGQLYTLPERANVLIPEG